MSSENCRHRTTPAAVHFALPFGHSHKCHHHTLDFGTHPAHLWSILPHSKVLQVLSQVSSIYLL